MTIVDSMAQVNLDMPSDMERWVESRVSRDHYLDAGEYLRALIRRDQAIGETDGRWMRARYEASLASGIVDAEPEDVIEEIIAEISGEDD